ncbi:unnamed protein product, partial [Rotaria sordida]
TTVTPLSIISSTTERPAETEITSITTGITGTQSSQPEETSSSVMLVSTVESTTPAPTILTTLTGSTTQPVTGTTPKQCEEMQAIDENVSKQITTSSDKLPKSESIKFQPTSTEGVSFDKDNSRPTITVHLGRNATIRSIRLPRKKALNGNVKQFAVTFYSL